MKKTTKARAYADDAPLTKAELNRLRFRPAREVDPELVAAYESGNLRYRGQRGAQKEPTKVAINLRVSPEVLAFFKSKGAGWQTRMNRTLQAIVDAVEK